MCEHPPIVLILGPTAAGKTELAVNLARRLAGPCPPGGECVCADSMQVYRGLDVGTAKPSAAQRAAVPHHMLDLLDPSETGYSVDRWLAAAEACIAAIRSRGRFPLVVGGTGLYVQALLQGLLSGPQPDPRLRQRLSGETLEELRKRLELADPHAARRIHRNDRRRTIRALEVFESTGRRLSTLQTQWADRARTDVRIVGLEPGRERLNARINARVRAMVAAGLVEEARGLWSAGRMGPQAREALGYRQLIEHFEGRRSLKEAIEQIKIRTRRLARQQRNWLRRFRTHPFSIWLAPDELTSQETVNLALAFIAEGSGGPGRGFLDSTSRGPRADWAPGTAD
jgi:tRNA dimethylallyltransferase